jgi:tRNA modification GTPase
MGAYPVSCKTGEGLVRLLGAIRAALVEAAGDRSGRKGFKPAPEEAASIGTERQKLLVDGALAALAEAARLADEGSPEDLIAPAIREAVEQLGMFTGEVSTEDILEEMFSRFCVGK